jgi:lipopolysaccharide export system protein LptA
MKNALVKFDLVTPALVLAALFFAAPFLLSPHAALAQQNPGLSTQPGDAPLEITADETLEWLREKKTFIARTNAIAAQGASSIKAQTLIAEYREGGSKDENKDESASTGGGMQIWRVSAQKDVVLRSGQSEAFGQDAVYDLDQGLATMTGDNLKMVMPDQTVTARDKFEYWVNDGRMNALGRAKIVRPKPGGGTDTLEADKVSAVFKDDEQGRRTLYSLEAIGNVLITTPAETITGAYGIYKADTNKAELTGGVKIKRGPNTLEGSRAEVDMNTSTSRIFGAENAPAAGTAPGRVKGVFYPGSEKNAKTR